MTDLFDYQREALDSLRGLPAAAIVLPTGTGKTFTFCTQAVEHLTTHGGRVLVVVDREDLIIQTIRTFATVAPGLPIGVVKGSRNETDPPVVIATRQSLGANTPAGARRRAAIRDVGLIIVDECDLAAAPQYARIIDHYRPRTLTGYTATFMRADGKALGKIFPVIAFERDTAWAVENRHLIRPFGRSVEVPDLHVISRRGDWTDEQVGDALAESLAPRLVVEKWIEEASGRKTLGFTPTVATARLFEEEFRAHGVWAETVHGGMPQAAREEAYDRHKPGTVLLNCMLLTVGFDRPDIDCVLPIRFTKNERLYIQMVGRGLRVDRTRPYDVQDCMILNVTGRGLPSLSGVSVLGLEDPEEEAKGRKASTDLTGLLDPGVGVEPDEDPFYDGVVEVVDFDPIRRASEHVWLTTDGGVRFLPASKDAFIFLFPARDSTFMVGWISRTGRTIGGRVVGRSPYAGLTLGAAMSAAEAYVRELLGNQVRASRKEGRYFKIGKRPSLTQIQRAEEYEVQVPSRITGPEMSDLLDTVEATRRIDPLVKAVRESGR